MYIRAGLTIVGLAATVRGQLAGTVQAEIHPSLRTQKCVKGVGCTNVTSPITLDATWRSLHQKDTFELCFQDKKWNPTYCKDPVLCAKQCALEGVDYDGTYGISTKDNAITLRFVTQHAYGTNVGSRVFLMATDTAYQLFSLKNQELSFDVDVSGMPCGINRALYFTQMDADGGLAKYLTNKAGAKFGTGYCSALCPKEVKFINGEANLLGWLPDPIYPETGSGNFGSCCEEMDVWEANSRATTMLAHPCANPDPQRCQGPECEPYSGICDYDGCDLNPYRNGNQAFYGPGLTIDTTKKFTVTTQWITDNGRVDGNLVEIRRKYIQNNQVITNIGQVNSMTDTYCAQRGADMFGQFGGLYEVGNAKYVLAMSVWDERKDANLWLDGGGNGPCGKRNATLLQWEEPHSYVVFSNIKFGDIDSTT